MMRFSRIVCVLAVCACVGFAYAKAIKITSLEAVGTGIDESPNADGMAILNWNQGQNRTEIQVALTDFLPGTEYLVNVATIFGEKNLLVSTNAAGNGQAHDIKATDITDNGNVCADVTVFIDEDGDFFPSLDSEIRAFGTNCP